METNMKNNFQEVDSPPAFSQQMEPELGQRDLRTVCGVIIFPWYWVNKETIIARPAPLCCAKQPMLSTGALASITPF